MSTLIAETRSPSGLTPVLRAEWTKIRSVRSTLWSLLLAFGLTFGIGAVFGLVLRGAYDGMSAEGKATFDPLASGLNGLTFGVIALVSFAVLAVGTEYSTGTIRTSLTAMPQRGRFYAGKLMVGSLLTFALAVPTVYATFFVSQAAIGEPSVSIGDPGVLRATFGACLYVTLLCLFAMAVTTMLRNTTLAMGILLPVFLILSEILSNIEPLQKVVKYLPNEAGAQMMRVAPEDGALGAGAGFLVLVGWAAAAVAGGYVLLRRRDA